jgi:CrcB protein
VNPSCRDALIVALGGGSGAVLRWLAASSARNFHLSPVAAIFAVNISGCFLFGFLHGFTQSRGHSWSLALLTGLLGGYTTFSTFSWDSYQLLSSGRPAAALANAAGSSLAGIAAIWLGLLAAPRSP